MQNFVNLSDNLAMMDQLGFRRWGSRDPHHDSHEK